MTGSPVTRRAVRAALSLLAMVATTVLAALPGSAAADASVLGGAGGSGPAVTLLGQSTWVGADAVFALRLGVGRDVPSTARIVVTAYPRLNNRTDFDAAADGQLGPGGGAAWIGQEPVSAAPPAAAGGVWARIPVGTNLTPADLETDQPFDPGNQSGVFPLQIQIIGANYTAIGAAISTFLVYSAGQAAFPRLLTAVTVPVSAPLSLSSKLGPAPLPAASSARLASLTAVLASEPGVTLSLTVGPQAAKSLAVGSATDRTTLRRLSTLVGHGDELLPALYAPVSTASLVGSGLADQVGPQLQAGAEALRSTLGVAPGTSTWVVDGPTDDATLQLLRHYGLLRLITAEPALSPLPAQLVTTTYARPTFLDDGLDASGAADLRVFGADATIAARATQPTDPVLAAEQTLAELAMIELETPSLVRGVAISLPAPTSLSPLYLKTLLQGLAANPFVQPVTATALLTDVPMAPPSQSVGTGSVGSGSVGSGSVGSGSQPAAPAVPVRKLRAAKVADVADAGILQTLFGDIRGLATFLPSDTALTDQLRQQLLIAPAAGLAVPRRQALLASMMGAVRIAESSVRLPGDTSVTLTSLKATLPLIVLSKGPLKPHVRLVLSSPKLDFRAFRPPGGSCRVEGRTTEVCTMVLSGPETVLRVPVESRTSGVFSLDVALTSPDGSLVLATAHDTVRSTAVSSVGIVIIVVSLVFLGVWWIRDIRSGRRARQLVHRPGDDLDDNGDGDGPPDGGSGPTPPPASHPVGPSRPVEPVLPSPPPVTVGELARPGGRRHRPTHAPVHRDPHDPRPVGDAPTGGPGDVTIEAGERSYPSSLHPTPVRSPAP